MMLLQQGRVQARGPCVRREGPPMHRLALLTLGALAASLEYGVQASAAPQIRRGTTVTAAFGVANSSPARSKAGRPRKSEYPPVVAPHSQTCAPVRLYEEIPAFPDSPSALVDSMVSSIVEGLCCEAADRRLRVELQGLRLLSGVSDEWRAAVGGPAGRLPLYEQFLLALRSRGYKRVLAVFDQEFEAAFIAKRLSKLSECEGYQVEHLQGRSGMMSVGHKQLVVFFHPRSAREMEHSCLTEVQRVTAVASLRGAGVVLVNPRLQASTDHYTGPSGVPLAPMLLSDFRPCFVMSLQPSLASPHLAVSVLMRATGSPRLIATSNEKKRRGWPAETEWEVYALDFRLPGSGWAFLESGPRPPSLSTILDRYFEPVPSKPVAALEAVEDSSE